MHFVDEATISIKAGHGGKGAVSFRREKFVPRGGPDGGNGGKGGDIVFEVQEGLTTLTEFNHRKHIEAKNGNQGSGQMKDGRDADDVILYVPPGTAIMNAETGEVLADLTGKTDRYIAAKGGRGGKGNSFFRTSTYQAPMYSQPGEEGEMLVVKLELKLLADVGLLGQPNAGKSTLLSVISKAKPKIANYPFTTLVPVLGVVVHKSHPAFTVADIPGLIEGASEGHGLGTQFLKHIERTAILVHMLSLSPLETIPIAKRFQKINAELKKYDPELSKRKQIVLLTQADLVESKKDLVKVVQSFKKKKIQTFVISSVTREGLDDFLDMLAPLVIKSKKKKK